MLQIPGNYRSTAIDKWDLLGITEVCKNEKQKMTHCLNISNRKITERAKLTAQQTST